MPERVELQPVLSGRLLELRPLLRSDHDPLYRVAADPLIWTQHPAGDRWRKPVFDAYFEDRIASGGALIAIEKSAGTVAGASEFHRFDTRELELEIGATFLARRFWGGAYNGEMKRLMIDHAFRFARAVVFAVSESNFRSRSALARIGAKPAHSFLRSGVPYLLYRITKSEWVRQ